MRIMMRVRCAVVRRYAVCDAYVRYSCIVNRQSCLLVLLLLSVSRLLDGALDRPSTLAKMLDKKTPTAYVH